MSTKTRFPSRPRPKRPDPSLARGFRVLAFFGFVLAGVLTVFLAFSLRHGAIFRAAIHAGLLFFTVRLIQRNLDNLAAAEGRQARASPPGGRSST